MFNVHKSLGARRRCTKLTKCRRTLFRFPPVGNEGGGAANTMREMFSRLQLRPEPYRTWRSHNESMIDMMNFGDYENAMDYFDTLKRHGPAPNVETYNLAFEAFHHAGTPFNIISQFQDMLERGLTPNATSVSWLIATHCYLNKIDEAVEIIKSASKWGIKPAIRSFCYIIDYYSKKGLYENAWDSVNAASAEHFLPIIPTNEPIKGDIEFYNSLILLYGNSKKIDEAEKLFMHLQTRDDVKPTVNTYLRLIEAYTANVTDKKSVVLFGGKIADILEHLLIKTYRGDPAHEYRIRWAALDALAKTCSTRIQDVLHRAFPLKRFTNNAWERVGERGKALVNAVGDRMDGAIKEAVPEFDTLSEEEKFELRLMETMSKFGDRPIPLVDEIYAASKKLHYESLHSLEKVEKEEADIRKRKEERQKAYDQGIEYEEPLTEEEKRAAESAARLQSGDKDQSMFQPKRQKFRDEFGSDKKNRIETTIIRPTVEFEVSENEEEEIQSEGDKEIDRLVEEKDPRREFILNQPPSERQKYLREKYFEATTHPVERGDKLKEEHAKKEKMQRLEVAHGQYYPTIFSKAKEDMKKLEQHLEKYDYPALVYEQTGKLIPPPGLTNRQRKEWYENQARLERRRRQMRKELAQLKETNPELYQRLMATFQDEGPPDDRRQPTPTDKELDIDSYAQNPVKGIAAQLKALGTVETELERINDARGDLETQLVMSGTAGAHPIATMALHRLQAIEMEQCINPKWRRDF